VNTSGVQYASFSQTAVHRYVLILSTCQFGYSSESRSKVYKELDHWYDEECQWKKKETKVALKKYKYRDDEY
jgi:bifunctional pyridoxal-dependent enzyme with beta-cystathionase and maltose regulon repressor activities